MSVAQQTSEQEYERKASPPSRTISGNWSRATRERPGMTWAHGKIVTMLIYLLKNQLDLHQYEVRINEGRVRRSPATISSPTSSLSLLLSVKSSPIVPSPAYLLPATSARRGSVVPLYRQLRCRHQGPRISTPGRPRDLAHPSVRADPYRLATPARRLLPAVDVQRRNRQPGLAPRRHDRLAELFRT